ncbi:OmpA family protein [Undibacterium sp. SXout7W]|uniref:OmpA family protein n=1 Tax=Undibacterium sp. SXout7W TaxID=3413049 RepID=UPI003BF44A70
MNTQKKIKSIIASLLTVSATVMATSVMADDYNPSWYLAPSLHAADIDDGFGPGSTSYGAGLRLGKPLSEQFDLQIGTTYTQSKNSYQRFYQNAYSIDGLYLFSRSNIRPFIVFGAGVERDRMNSSLGKADRYSPNVNLGIGLQYVLNDQFSLQADWRKVHGYLRGDGFGFQQASNNFLSVALNYSFEKTPTRATPVTKSYEAPVNVIASNSITTPPPPPPARFEKITLSATELFGFDSYTLPPEQRKLDEIANALNANIQINNIVITGYTDRIGSKKYNQKLSEQRASAVKNYLEGKGVSANRMSVFGKGENNPIVQCTEKSRSKLIDCLEPNRRVEIDQITIEKRIE